MPKRIIHLSIVLSYRSRPIFWLYVETNKGGRRLPYLLLVYPRNRHLRSILAIVSTPRD